MSLRRLLLLTAFCAMAQKTPGLDPRPDAADYPARGSNAGVSLGAGFASGADQRKTLGRDWSGSYVVVEVGLYPEPGHVLTAAPRDFMLRAGSESLAPVDADAIVPYANHRTGPLGPDSNVHTYGSETVGVATGPYGRKTVYTDSQVGVAVGNPPGPVYAPAPGANDPKSDLRFSLERSALPDIKTASPVAGYLYFPKPKHADKNAAYALDFYGAEGQVKLPLPLPKKR